MNFNDNPERLKKEEQIILDTLISRMDKVLHKLDDRMKGFVSEAKNSDISVNPDSYLSQVLARQGIKDTEENRKKLLQARDELYKTRLLVQYENEHEKGIDEIKVGLHSCHPFVVSWAMPVCRQFVLNNSSTEFESIVKDKNGDEYHTNYKLIVKNQVELRFTRVVKAMNLFPGLFDEKTLKEIKGTRFISESYLDEMIKKFNPKDYEPDAAAKIIADEFLQELLERRSTPEFKNIVFSIQKKQGEIIQASYNRDMIVQGCAGSGKSMIMLHRLPILLYDNPNSLKRTNLYIITPSQMYIQLAESMRYQLEISDINMGTIEKYFDYCIAKYPGHEAGEYGKINYSKNIGFENEQYVYSQKCIDDICEYFAGLEKNYVSLDKAYSVLDIKDNTRRSENTFAQRISNRVIILQNILNKNNLVLAKYFKGLVGILESLSTLSTILRHRKTDAIREITKLITMSNDDIAKAEKELEKLSPTENAVAVQNRRDTIENAQKRIETWQVEILDIEADKEYFAKLEELNNKIEDAIEPFKEIKDEFSLNTEKEIYAAIDLIGHLIGKFYMLSWDFSKLDDKYVNYLGAIRKTVEQTQKKVVALQEVTEKYLDFEYFTKIKEEKEVMSIVGQNAIKNAYEMVMKKVGIKPTASGNIRGIKCSPYLYLQALYCYQGAPSAGESLLAIDEAQSISPEEIKLLKNINDNKVVFNMFGDIYQHIEGTKGIDDWNEYKEIVDYDYYEMQENYRNASQITEYCNRVFGMNMNPINTPGKGVHLLTDDVDFVSEITTQLLDTQRTGLAAILVSNAYEAKFLLDLFSEYKNKFHDMTEEEFSVHRTRWNIITIDEAKGLEFSSVIVLSGRMSRNEKYIAFTRALDDLYIYEEMVDISEYEKKQKNKEKEDSEEKNTDTQTINQDTNESEKADIKEDTVFMHDVNVKTKKHEDSAVRSFFEEIGLEVIDNRDNGGRLWVIGDKKDIREFVNAAITKFGISGKYAFGKESKFKKGWCTKSDK